MLEGRLGEDVEHLYAWLKLSYENLRDEKLVPGLLLSLVGPPDMHKTRTQELVISGVLGWRTAAPESYFSQKTEFNGDFAAAEHRSSATSRPIPAMTPSTARSSSSAAPPRSASIRSTRTLFAPRFSGGLPCRATTLTRTFWRYRI